MSLTFRVLKSEQDLEVFAQRSCALVGNQVPVDYFKASRVIGAFSKGQMVGGWSMAYPSFNALRCLAAIPEDHAAKKETRELLEKGLLCEFTQLWLDPAGANARQSIRFWLKLAEDVMINAAPFVVFGFNAKKSGLRNLYNRLSPRVLYDGPMSSSSHIKSHAEVTIMLIARNKFRFLFWRNLGEAMRRFFRRKRGIQKIAQQPVAMNGAVLEVRKLG